MATINVNPDQVALVRLDEPVAPAVAGEPIQKGQNTGADAATGRQILGGGGSPQGVAITRAVRAKYAVSVLKKGIVELGDGLQALDFGAPVFAALDGSLDDAGGSGANTRIGTVVEGWGDKTARKLLRVNA